MDVYIKQEKFHQIVLKRYRITRIQKDKQTIRRLLCYYQELACKAYPTEAKMSLVLGEYYDAKFHVSLTSFGSYSLLVYSLTAVDPCYLSDESYTLEKLEALFDEFIQPKMNQGKANLELFNRAYEIYESDLLSLQEDTQATAYQNAILEYFKGTNREFYNYGTLNELQKITPKDLYDYYQTTLEEETISICTGHVFSKRNLKSVTLKPKKDYHFKERGTPKPYVEVSSDTNQCYLYLIYDMGIFADDKAYYACMLLNHLLGGNSSSYLFTIVREKYGLCYSIHSTYLGASGIILVSCALEPQQLKQGLKAIDEAVLSLSKMDFDIEEAKQFYLSNHYIGKDYIDTAIHNYLGDHYFLDTPKSSLEVESIQAVTKEEVMEAYKKLKKSFTYVFGGPHEK